MFSTNDYDLFILRPDNRQKIDLKHVAVIKESMETRGNQLQRYPIQVNAEMEITNGQHRFLAAKELGVTIYYEIMENWTVDDIYVANLSKGWTNTDYLNFFCKNGNEDYLKLKQLMEKHDITLRLAFYCVHRIDSFFHNKDFKKGNFIFKMATPERHIELLKRTIEFARMHLGNKYFFVNMNFQKSLLIIFDCEGFQEERWFAMLEKLIYRVTIKPRMIDYIKTFQSIYNYHCKESCRIYLPEDVKLDP